MLISNEIAAAAAQWWSVPVSFLSVVVAAAIPVLYAARQFVKQKEYEIVRERYLERGFDEIIAAGERAMNAHTHNWGYALNVLKIFRDVPSEVDLAELELDRFRLSEKVFPYAAASRVMRATKSRAPWDALQLIVAFSNKSHEFCVIEMPKVIKAHIAGRTNASNAEIARDSVVELERLMNQADAYQDALGTIGVLALEFETSKFDLKSVDKFSERPNVNLALKKLQVFIDDRAGGQALEKLKTKKAPD